MRSKRELQRALKEVGNIGALEFLLEREDSTGHGAACISRPIGVDGYDATTDRRLHRLIDGDWNDKWKSWVLGDSVESLPFGVLRVHEGAERCLARSRVLKLVPDSVYEVRFKYRCQSPASKIYLTLTPIDAEGKVDFFKANYLPVPVEKGAGKGVRDLKLYFQSGSGEQLVTLNICSKRRNASFLLSVDQLEMNHADPPRATEHFDDESSWGVFASIASIPGRVDCLERTVKTLYDQVDRVRIFLNEYPDVPDFLKNDPKILVERSQVHGDQGDSGKFFWSGAAETGVQLICDDDLAYPPDYAERMTASLKRYGWQCVVGVHCLMMKQPVRDYYKKAQRHVWHFRNGLPSDRFCHVLGTGTIAYHSEYLDISRYDFPYRNMADAWLAKLAVDRGVGLVGCSRPHNWIRQLDTSGESIYLHSAGNRDGCKNTGKIQTTILRNSKPLTVPRGVSGRPKVVLGIKTYNRVDYLKACIESFLNTRSSKYQWVVIVADDGSTDGTKDYLHELNEAVELHVIENYRRYAVGQSNTIYELSRELGFDYGFNVDDDLVFLKAGWDELYINAIESSGYSHLVHRHLKHAKNLLANKGGGSELADPAWDKSLTGVAFGDAYFDLGTGSLVTFTPDTLQKVGYADEVNFPIRGQWHVDYHIRCARAGCNELRYLFDAQGSNDYLEIQNYLRKDYRCAIPWGEEYKKTKDREELARREKVMSDPARIYVGAPKRSREKGFQLGAVWVDKVYVLNLDRRPDRWRSISSSASKVGIPLERFPAVDGTDSSVRALYEEYAESPLISVAESIRITNTRDLRRADAPHMARVAFFEQKAKRKAIGSPGAWGYLCTMIGILRDAIEAGHDTILVLDDDCQFHRSTDSLAAQQSAELPEDWLIWQLGALQYNWSDNAIDWCGDGLYSCHGTSVGSHATVLRAGVLPMILNECERFDLPYDEGPLFLPKAVFPRQCLTSYPNIAIQDIADSDISDTTAQQAKKHKISEIYRWTVSDYS